MGREGVEPLAAALQINGACFTDRRKERDPVIDRLIEAKTIENATNEVLTRDVLLCH